MKYIDLGKKPTRHGFGEGLKELGDKNPNVVAIGADVTGSVMTSYFRDAHPDRFFSVGVAEQNATTVAVGFALSGKIPFFSSYSAFAAFRNADQLRVSVCYNDVNVKICGGHSGVTVGPDGATHQSLEEVSLLRALPNLTLVVPADYNQAKKATIAIGEMVGPAFLRVGRSPSTIFIPEDKPFELGKAEVLREGKDVVLFANGIMVWQALLAAEELEKREGIQAKVVNVHTIKPLDYDTIVASALECGAGVTAEEHQVYGGLSGTIAEALSKNFPIPLEFVGMKDTFGGSGEPDELLEIFGLNWKSIYGSALKAIERKIKGYSGVVRKLTDIETI